MIEVDLFFLNVFFTVNVAIWFLSLALRLEKKYYLRSSSSNPKLGASLLIPLFREKPESVMVTAKNVAKQTYPRELMEVVLIVEPDDEQTKGFAPKVVEFLEGQGIRCRVVESDGRVKLKAHALNCALRVVESDVVAVYDADDVFPEDQVEKAVALMEQGYDAVGTRVYRYRKTILGSFLLLDTFIWYNIFLPFFQAVAKAFPLSGEGLFVKKRVLEAVGGFPEVLAEDAYLTILLAEKGFKIALLDSEVEELAPKGWRSAVKQRLRWFRGYAQCLARLAKAKLSLKSRLGLLFAYWSPAVCGASLITTTFFALYWVTWAFAPHVSLVAPWMTTTLYARYMYYWSALLAYVISLTLLYTIAYLIAGGRFERLVPYVILLPFYWTFLGLIALLTPFAPSRRWLRTERR
jgi:cellulose synthase/poly-beta-1,6-N-acetylglucosamine synthase-like glycosyltransferase